MAEVNYKQDMPPKGGYAPIVFQNIPVKKYFNGYTMFAGFAAITSFSFYMYYQNFKRRRLLKIERQDAINALEPILLAERDRSYLKQLRRNVEEEAELMKNVPGWEVGTYYGEPIYKTVPKEKLLDPILEEYYAHTSEKAYDDKANEFLWR
ncbi:NADH dehydrogenase [ubiquinone] 1 alpha subcomplex subunit 13-like [Limulus polyphemus]|uniref:NADH dehydrogenase [ubiquinone] 1 alpha subcomplex subunit 13 n=1 Tax=Limulus polyphemus TaxID=6850 RepID=A0ABM1BUV0_LIMPO|nr:NADH dehydrogenase [ubiquinone] 1 alpha subcomplex subunit 13-like [Limulus polyphemus]